MRSYVRLSLAAETYAVPVEHVLEAAELAQVRPVPGARPELLGVSNLRGQILPVADLAALLGAARVRRRAACSWPRQRDWWSASRSTTSAASAAFQNRGSRLRTPDPACCWAPPSARAS